MTLEQIVKEIKQLRPFAEENVEVGPKETLSGRRGRKSQAIDRLTTLVREYKQELLRSAIFIVVSGSLKQEFVDTSVANYDCLAADPEEFYNDLASRIPSTLYLGKEGLSNVFDVIGRHLEDKAMQLDLSSYPQIIFKQQYSRALNSKEDFTSLVKEAINEQMGAEIVGIQAVASITKGAIEKGHKEVFTPILLATDDDNLTKALLKDLRRLTHRVLLVGTGKVSKEVRNTQGVLTLKKIEEEEMTKLMLGIRNNLRN